MMENAIFQPLADQVPSLGGVSMRARSVNYLRLLEFFRQSACLYLDGEETWHTFYCFDPKVRIRIQPGTLAIN